MWNTTKKEIKCDEDFELTQTGTVEKFAGCIWDLYVRKRDQMPGILTKERPAMTNEINPTSATEDEKFPAPSVFVEEALRYTKEAADKGVPLRILGGLAIYLHSQNESALWNSLGRIGSKVFTDIDLMGYSRLMSKIIEYFESMGYTYSQTALLARGSNRIIFFGKTIPIVDVFMDKLDMCHTIDFRNRLELDYPTISLADLLLEKLQIVQLNEKDIKDTIVLLRAHDLGGGDRETINTDYIASLLSRDWGFYYTFTTNLAKTKEYIFTSDALAEHRDDLNGKIEKIAQRIQSEPKTTGWKMREKVGPRKKWYQDVGDPTR